MAWFGSKSSASNSSTDNANNGGTGSISTNPIAAQLKEQVKQELAIANATELVNKASDNCFEQCLIPPYSSNNNGCVDDCLAKYLRSWNVVSKAYIARIQDASKSGEI